MKKTVYLIHGWGGNSQKDWFPWIKKELEIKGFEVIAEDMPDTLHPTIKNWVGKLIKIVKPDKNAILVGHSIGCQAIMRYLESLPANKKIKAVIFVAGWLNLTDNTWDDTFTKEIADEWINTAIDLEKIKLKSDKFIVIHSDNDPYVEMSDVNTFYDKLSAKKIIVKNKGHITGEDGIKEFPILLDKILEVAK